MLIKGNEINLPSLHDLSAHGWGHLTVPCPASLKCIIPKEFIPLQRFWDLPHEEFLVHKDYLYVVCGCHC